MNPSNPQPNGGFDLDAMLSWALLIGLSLWGGLASFVRKMKDGHVRAFNITELVGELTVSGFTGVVMANICDSIHTGEPMKYALVGITAHMGSRALFKLESFANQKLNLPPDPPASEPTKETDHAA
jgi:hypothetical protein